MVAENRGEVVFCAYNRHNESCGVPSAATNAAPDDYCGYFENEHGEQWVFVYDRATKRGILAIGALPGPPAGQGGEQRAAG